MSDWLLTAAVALAIYVGLMWAAHAGTNCISTHVGNTTYTYCY